jgi:hypothetical protein
MAFWIIIAPLVAICFIADAYERKVDWNFWVLICGGSLAVILKSEVIATVVLMVFVCEWLFWRGKELVKSEVQKELTARSQR